MFREIITLSNKTTSCAFSQTEDPFELLARAINNLDEIRNVIEIAKEDENYWDRLPVLVQRIEEERRQKIETTIKCDTFPSFNTATGGLQKGNLVVISGKYKAGKTRFAYALLIDYAVNKKIPVGMIGLEMGQEEYDKILLSMQTGTRYEYLRDPAGKNKDGSLKLKDELLYEMKLKAEQIFPKTTIMISDSETYDVEIKAKIKYWVKKHKLKIVCIDYLQLVETTNKYERRDLVIAYLSRTFKNLARQLGIILFIIVQENEKGESADSKAPLRDSDFWFSVTHPIDEGKQTVRIDGDEISVDQSHFLIKFKASRHSPNGGIFLTKFYENGEYKEFDHHY